MKKNNLPAVPENQNEESSNNIVKPSVGVGKSAAVIGRHNY